MKSTDDRTIDEAARLLSVAALEAMRGGSLFDVSPDRSEKILREAFQRAMMEVRDAERERCAAHVARCLVGDSEADIATRLVCAAEIRALK